MTAQQIIDLLGLVPHPEEGGFFAETYRSEDKLSPDCLPDRYGGERQCSTAIYYLLTPDTFSALHRLNTDEIFHFYLGDPVEILLLYTDGSSRIVTLGQNLANGQKVQFVIPQGTWLGAALAAGGKFALLGTTMAPGFDYDDYQGGSREKLIKNFPARKNLIEKLCPK